MPRTIIAFGEVLWDLLPTGPVMGGASLNFAYRLGMFGDRACVISRLGEDELGRAAFRAIEALGMETKLLQWDVDHPTGTVPVRLDAAGVPDFTIVPDVAYDYIHFTPDLHPLIARADCIYFGTLIQRAPVSRYHLHALLERAGHCVKVLDLNLRRDCYTDETVLDSLKAADIVKLNEDELRVVADWLGLPCDDTASCCDELLRRFDLTHCIVTMGERGVFAAAEDEHVFEPGFVVEVVDTVGSGDAFTAAFIHYLLDGQPLKECCRAGNALGALAATTPGGAAPIILEDLRAFLDNHG